LVVEGLRHTQHGLAGGVNSLPNFRPPGPIDRPAQGHVQGCALLCLIHDVASGHGLQLARQVAGSCKIVQSMQDLGFQLLVLGIKRDPASLPTKVTARLR
jgi:hypothetical protein